MDVGDRYLNAKCGKALVRENKIQESIDMMLLFTNKDPISDDHIDQLQCMWYEIECSHAYMRTRKCLKAFNLLSHTIGHFYQLIEDEVNYL